MSLTLTRSDNVAVHFSANGRFAVFTAMRGRSKVSRVMKKKFLSLGVRMRSTNFMLRPSQDHNVRAGA